MSLQAWKDPQLEWDREEFDLEEIRIPIDKVWNPEIVLLNK